MRRRQNNLIRNLFIASLIILAAMHPNAVSHLTQLATELILAITNGIATAAADNPGPALLIAGALYIAHQARTHHSARARTHH